MTEGYIIVVFLIIFCIILGKLVVTRKWRKNLLNKHNQEVQKTKNSADVSLEKVDDFIPAVSIEFNLVENPEVIPIERKHEIKDIGFIKNFNLVIPTAAQFIQQTLNNASLIDSIDSQLGNIGKVYSVKLSNDQKLAQWKNKPGTLQGVSRERGTIKEFAELRDINVKDNVKVRPATLISVANIMQVASMAVGQYYMSEIDNKMSLLDKKINQITDFLEGSLKAELKSDIAVIKMLSKFSLDVYENKEELNRRLTQIDGSTKNLYKIVTQTNLVLKNIINEIDLDFKEYTESIEQIERWQEVQKVALSTLIEATQLKILLTQETELSFDYLTELLNQAMEDTQILIQELKSFHRKYEEKFDFDFEKVTRKNDRIILSWFIKERSTDNNLLLKVINQKQMSYSTNINKIVYSKSHDVELIVEDGKLYYLENYDCL